MGRKKSAPQPLSIPNSNAAASTTPTRSRDSSAVSSAVGPGTFTSASTTLSAGDSRSPSSATVPRSSPFTSKFAPKRPQTARPGGQSSSHRVAESVSFGQRRPSQSYIDTQGQQSTTYIHTAPHFDSPTAPAQSESRKSRAGLFHFSKPSKSAGHFMNQTPQGSQTELRADSDADRRPSASTRGDDSQTETSNEPPPPLRLRTSRSELSLTSAGERESTPASAYAKKNKPKSFGLLTRTKSLRDKEISSPTEVHDPMPSIASQPTQLAPDIDSPALRTAPASNDRSFRDMMDSTVRNRSEDRAPASNREGATSRENRREKENREYHRTIPAAARENGSSTFLTGLRNSSTKAAGMFGSRFFSRTGRGAAAHERPDAPLDDEHYELKVLNLPLADQTRKTRISKRLEDSKDKTEFWMPAFPWRAIDYLNYKGCEMEGLYRVPGSGPQIKRWQRKFDEELDVDLFHEKDLYDINIIGSMLKAWLRELPDELFPKDAQERIARECAGSETVPQMLVDELSNLSPFQYYLLFAITCHLSLLLAHSDKNKMDFRNLCICFQPCMKIDVFCFKFLVCDWRDCWKGCKNENQYIEQEYVLLNQPPPRALGEAQEPELEDDQDGSQPGKKSRTPSPGESTNSSKQSERSTTGDRSGTSRKPGALPESASKNSVGSHDSTISTTITINSDRDTTKAAKGDLRRLSPIQPLSPLGF